MATGRQNKDINQYNAFVLHWLIHGVFTEVELKASHADTGNFETCI